MTEATVQAPGCKRCGQPLLRKGRRGPLPTYCSAVCKARAKDERARVDGRYEKTLAALRTKNAKAREANAKPCPYCGDPMTHPRRIQCGKPDCKRQYNADKGREYQRQRKAQTGEWLHRRYVEQQRESERRRREERQALGLPVGRQRYPDKYAKSDAERRMLKAAAIVETFDPREIFERDSWICQLCSQPVDERVAWPDRMSPSLDHIIPISRGGDHSRANSRLSHLGCNSSRGNRGGGEQLALIG